MPKGGAANQELIYHLLHAEEGYIQALRLTAEVLSQINLMPYNLGGLRFLQLAAQAIPDAASLHLKLGLANLQGQQWEGLLYLQQARALAPSFAPIIQALYLAYRTLEPEVAAYWLQYGQDCAQDAPHDPAWAWTQLPLESPFTYVPFDQLLLAVDPSLDSIVTSVLLGEGDWFETEMEFWRRQLQPGMTVIDVGANVGVYSFSGAQRVGPTGKVLAVEPFSGCVCCLQETRRLNQFDWVKICEGAASDRHGIAHLALQAASELNEIVSDATAQSDQEVEEILCFPLDSLIEQEGLTRVDWLKIDAEGHEMQVLAGSEQLLTKFAPGILYENISALQKSNTDVAEYLLSKGYKLFRYQPFLGNLIPLESLDQLKNNLNIIALPASLS
jgi:FkbM family methyltransferase